MQDANYKMMKTNKQLIGIDLFAGAGGLSLGAEMAGISMRYAVEADAMQQPHIKGILRMQPYSAKI